MKVAEEDEGEGEQQPRVDQEEEDGQDNGSAYDTDRQTDVERWATGVSVGFCGSAYDTDR